MSVANLNEKDVATVANALVDIALSSQRENELIKEAIGAGINAAHPSEIKQALFEQILTENQAVFYAAYKHHDNVTEPSGQLPQIDFASGDYDIPNTSHGQSYLYQVANYVIDNVGDELSNRFMPALNDISRQAVKLEARNMQFPERPELADIVISLSAKGDDIFGMDSSVRHLAEMITNENNSVFATDAIFTLTSQQDPQFVLGTTKRENGKSELLSAAKYKTYPTNLAGDIKPATHMHAIRLSDRMDAVSMTMSIAPDDAFMDLNGNAMSDTEVQEAKNNFNGVYHKITNSLAYELANVSYGKTYKEMVNETQPFEPTPLYVLFTDEMLPSINKNAHVLSYLASQSNNIILTTEPNIVETLQRVRPDMGKLDIILPKSDVRFLDSTMITVENALKKGLLLAKERYINEGGDTFNKIAIGNGVANIITDSFYIDSPDIRTKIVDAFKSGYTEFLANDIKQIARKQSDPETPQSTTPKRESDVQAPGVAKPK